MNEDVKNTIIAAKVQCMAGRLYAKEDPATIQTDCNIAADLESGTITLSVPEKDFVLAVRFDELLQIMAEGIVLSHQIHDGEEGGADGIE